MPIRRLDFSRIHRPAGLGRVEVSPGLAADVRAALSAATDTPDAILPALFELLDAADCPSFANEDHRMTVLRLAAEGGWLALTAAADRAAVALGKAHPRSAQEEYAALVDLEAATGVRGLTGGFSNLRGVLHADAFYRGVILARDPREAIRERLGQVRALIKRIDAATARLP